jgi:BlaI family transcriptional regulator, penicillinase repressor
MANRDEPRLSPLEGKVMNVVWANGVATADDVRAALARSRPLKESTVRTILRRLEGKGFVEHTVEGRTFHYLSKVAPQNVASQAVRGIIERFCAGSVENLLVGMVKNELVSADALKGVADKIAKAEAAQKRKRQSLGE